MRLVVLPVMLTLAGRLATPSAAAAQYHRLSDAVVVGTTLASAGSGASVMAGGPEMGALIEVPVSFDLRVRGEAATGFWRFNGHPYDAIPGSRMRRHRLTATVIRSRVPLSPARRLSAYSGAGAGLYLYRFPARPNGGAWGIHCLTGAEYLLRTTRSRWILGAEVQVHLMGQPRGPHDVTVMPMLGAHVGATLKYRLP
jgi:hypothetical protein